MNAKRCAAVAALIFALIVVCAGPGQTPRIVRTKQLIALNNGMNTCMFAPLAHSQDAGEARGLC